MRTAFKQDRDKDFFAVCEQVRKEHGSYISVKDIACKAVKREADGYYLTTKQIINIIHYKRCNPDKKTRWKQGLYTDIFQRYWSIKKENPGLTVSKIAKIIDEEKAPRFYMTEKSATNLLYYLIKNRPRNAIHHCPSIHNHISDR